MRNRFIPLLALLPWVLAGCMPAAYPPGAKIKTARLLEQAFLTEDGLRLPMRRWLPNSEPRAVIVALHGFNDYSQFFQMPGDYLKKQGIASFTYDQRGFGAAPKLGLWPGHAAYVNDLLAFTRLVKERYPKQPVYWLGESMGGAIVIAALSQHPLPDIAGTVLVAPAVWARSAMPWYQTGLLWTLAHSLPWLTLTGKGLNVMPSDNMEMLTALRRDPLALKGSRVETLYGLANLMDLAFASAPSLSGRLLLLYGKQDQIIPKQPMHAFLQQLLFTDPAYKTVAVYPDGYHMLLRGLNAPIVWQDLATWIHRPRDPLPSGADRQARQWLADRP